jgi:phage protein D
MDRETRTTIWADVTDSDAVSSILANYGYTPDVQSTSAGHYENKHTLVQRDSDLRFVRRLARRNGFLFWVTCDNLGVETAHFKRPPLNGQAAAELVINLDSPSLRTVDLTWDVERPTSVVGAQLDLNTKENLTGDVASTPQTILGDNSLAAITGDTRSVHLSAPVDDAGDLQARGEGVLIESDWFIRATCQTSLETFGKLMRAHGVVELRGAGSRHSGKYFVAAVRHIIDATAHKMDLTLIRNGWG